MQANHVVEQASLEDNIAYQATLLNHISDAVIATDLDFRITSWNRGAESMYGWKTDEVVGQLASEYLATDYANTNREEMLRQIQHQGAWVGEAIQSTKAGVRVYVQASLSLVHDAFGHRIGYVAVNRDITTQKKSEKHLRILAEATKALAAAKPNQREVLDIVTHAIGNILCDTCILFLCSDDRQSLYNAACYDHEPNAVALLQSALKDIPVQSSHLAAQVVRNGRILLQSADDIKRLHSTLASPELTTPLLNRRLPHSEVAVPLFIQGQTIGVLALSRFRPNWSSFNQDDMVLIEELADRAALAISNARAFEQAEHELAERKEVESALQSERALLARRVEERTADLSLANSELARAVRLKDEFLANVSHELRTPLNSVLGRSETMLEGIYGPLTTKQVESLRGIEESGRHLLSLINDILDLSKIESGALELEVESISVDLLCALSLRMVTQIATQKQIKITQTIQTAVDYIRGDERRLKQILVNLLSNAVKFTPVGGRIGLEVSGDVERQTVKFCVWDTGIGIAEEHLSRLFKPFMQIDSSLTRQHDGTGLGLALVLRLTEAHHGSVSVESTLGRGSQFCVTLPWDTSTIVRPSIVTQQTQPTVVAAYQPAFHRALVIEDSPSSAQLLTRYLNDLGIKVILHTTGQGVIRRAIEAQADLILLDILLPNQSGWDVLRELKSNGITKSIPVMIVSVVNEPNQAYDLGAAALLEKPVNRDQLAQALNQISSQQGTSDRKTDLFVDESPARPTILLAEDNQANIDVVQDYLLAKGYEVVVARNGNEALHRIEIRLPDLVIMDIQMPVMDGLTAIRTLRKDPATQQLPIIALTALAMPGDRERCLEAGANDYLVKPVNLKVLLASIAAHINSPKA